MSKRIVLYTLIPKGFLCGNLRKLNIFFFYVPINALPGRRAKGGGGGACLQWVTDIKWSGFFDYAS